MSAVALAATLAAGCATGPAHDVVVQADPPNRCENCAELNEPFAPFKIYGNTYYVGPRGLASILIASSGGLILIDGALAQSAPLIADNVRKLGFRVEDIRLIVNSHAHYDHAGGIAALARASGAEVAASASGAQALERGGPTDDDPQRASADADFPSVPHVRVVADGETLRVGEVELTAHLTPGHTPGSTTWTWRSCETDRCLDMVDADSLTAVSSPGFRFTGDAAHPSRIETFRRSISKVGELPCDVLLSPHPRVFAMEAKLAARKADPDRNPFIDPEGCRAYAAAAAAGLDQRIAAESVGGLDPQ